MEVTAKKSYGQHFLNDTNILNGIAEAAAVGDDDTIVEIGAGLGSLTFVLAKKAKKVISIEADRELADSLRDKLPKNVTLITGDALQVDWTVTIEGDYKLVANIPYSITSPLLRKIYGLKNQPTVTVLLMQKEVANRLLAKPGSSERGLMTVMREANSTAEIVLQVAPGSFTPPPKVDSSAVRFTPISSKSASIFWPLIETAFSHKRQKLSNAIGGLPIAKARVAELIVEAKIDPNLRPQELTFEQWQDLSAKISANLSQ